MDIIRGSSKKPAAADGLIKIFRKHFASEEGVLYIGYPFLPCSGELLSVDALWVSKAHGVVAFDLVEGKDASQFGETQDNIANLLDVKFRRHKTLLDRRTLLVPLRTLTFAPMLVEKINDNGSFLMFDEKDVVEYVNSENWKHPNLYESVLSALQSISPLRRSRRERINTDSKAHAMALKDLEDSILNLDTQQSKAVMEATDNVQRIRGLSGSGKTTVLALKAAYLHSRNPDWRIAVTFHTRSLKNHFSDLIHDFVFAQTGNKPNGNLKIVNAWGAPGGENKTGIYYEFCSAHNATYLNYGPAMSLYGPNMAFAGAVKSALDEIGDNTKKLYDAILVDEAQDFDPVFLKMCYRSLGAKKRLVYAYDEIQNLTGTNLPEPEEIFGNDPDGMPFVTFGENAGNRDITLGKCYRNSRSILTSAHALSFGIYRTPDKKSDTGLVQMFDRPELWKDTGYEVLDGILREGRNVVLGRSDNASPKFLEKPHEVEDSIIFRGFRSPEQQAKWVAEEIQRNLEKDGLCPDDIIVINPDTLSTRADVGPIRKILFDNNIQSHTMGIYTPGTVFFEPSKNSVGFLGILQAKGSETGMVYVINAQNCYNGEAQITRNILYTAMTRSKAWVRVVGHGKRMENLVEEYEKVKERDYKLEFTYPDSKVMNKLKCTNGEVSAKERRRAKFARKELSTIIRDLKKGDIHLGDLPNDELRAFREILEDMQ